MAIICKMIKCSNQESKGIKELNQIKNLNIDTKFTFGTIISSKIKNIEFDEDLIVINTLNTQYVFQK